MSKEDKHKIKENQEEKPVSQEEFNAADSPADKGLGKKRQET